MNTKKWLFVALGLAVTGSFAYWAARRLTTHVYASQPLSLKPYVLTRGNFNIDPKTGNAVMLHDSLIAQRSDGMRVRVEVMGGQPMRRVDDPNGWVALISDKLKLKSTAKLPEHLQAQSKTALQHPPPNCLEGLNEMVDGEEMLENQRALRIITSESTGLERFIDWKLPEFGCVTVQIFRQTRPNLGSEWTTIDGAKLLTFTAHEPDARLFSDHSTYAELKPSELTKTLLKESGVDEKNCPKCFEGMAKGDYNYQQWHKALYP